MIALTIGEIAGILQARLVDGGDATAAERVVHGPVETDSRDIVDGGVFVAKPGEETDGHRFVGAAAERGAALAIVEHEVEACLPQLVVADAVAALAALATAVVARVRARGALRIIGITGSNGKTTTKNLLRAICEREGATVASRHSFNNEVGGPLTMLEIDFDTRFLVAEMGASHVGDIASLVAMAKPDVGVVLKVGLAHAGEFGGIERTVQAKSEMVTALTPDDIAVLNLDDPRVAGMAARTAAAVHWFGLAPGADVTAREIVAGPGGTDFVLVTPLGERAVHFAVLGEHHVANALAAAAAALALGIGLDHIVAGLESVVRAEHWRMEVQLREPFVLINDAYNASPDSMAAALRALAQVANGGRTVAVLGEMAELGDLADEEHDRIGALTVRLDIGLLVVVGDRARRIAISAEREGSLGGEIVWVPEPGDAEALLGERLLPGDTVLVKSSKSADLRFLGDRIAAAHGAEVEA